MKSILLKYLFKSILLLVLFVVACKKDNPSVNPDDGANTKQTATTDRIELTNDSIFLYAKEIYYWNDKLPTYDVFEPRQYTSGTDLEKYERNLLDLVKYSGYEYIEGQNYPKFSYIEDRDDLNPNPMANLKTASVDLEGNGNDIGIRPVFYLYEDDSYLLFVTAVYDNSPAFKNGVRRGWVITKVNGEEIGKNYTNERNKVTAALNDYSVRIEGMNYIDKSPFNVLLTSESYKSNPIYTSKILTVNSTKIGYIALARFSNRTNAFDALDSAFENFLAVENLIVDLRYNGGGYVNTAEHLINLIVPTSNDGKVMFSEHYNSLMQESKATILKNQPDRDDNDEIIYKSDNKTIQTYADFDYSVSGNTRNIDKGRGPTNISKVVFIVSDNTASASELVINSLTPYMDVKLVGTKTYGKPVGFFPIRLENKYDLYLSLFSTRNSNNEGDYYEGIQPDEVDEFDDPQYEFGDVRENYLQLAINQITPGYIETSSRVSSKSAIMSIDGSKGKRASEFHSKDIRPAKKNSEFVGMIENRKPRRK